MQKENDTTTSFRQEVYIHSSGISTLMNTIYSILSLNAHYYDNAEISTVFDEVRTKIRLMQSIYDTLYKGNDVASG